MVKKTKIQIEYDKIIEKSGAEIIQALTPKEAECEYEELFDAAKKNYGEDFVLASYEIWHDGGVKAQFIPNKKNTCSDIKIWLEYGKRLEPMV